MKDIGTDIFPGRADSNTGETKGLTLVGFHGEKVTLAMSREQMTLLDIRAKRTFSFRCAKEILLGEIGRASSCAELKRLAEGYGIADVCEMGDMDLNGAKGALKAVATVLYRYPRLRSRLCFIGTHHSLKELLIPLGMGDASVLRKFGLQHICPPAQAAQLGAIVLTILREMIDGSDEYVATAMSAFGMFDAVLFDRNDYEGNAYLQLAERMRRSEQVGFHPAGCGAAESVTYHELGHLLERLCELSKSAEFEAYFRSLTDSEIKRGLSEYALTSPTELIAEAFCECMCVPHPRPIASTVGGMLDAAYGRCD